MKSSIRTVVAATAIAAAATTTAVVAASPAAAYTRHTVCAQTLTVRSAPGGSTIGTLVIGETFDVYQYVNNGSWAYGFAWGHVNHFGYVVNGYFC